MSDPSGSQAVVLLNAGRTEFRKSVRGEPRGPLCGMGICFECRVDGAPDPHQRTCMRSSIESAGTPTASVPIEVDVAVVGAGPGGLAAASRAAEGGRRTLIIDAAQGAGGQIWRCADERDRDRASSAWIARTRRAGVQSLALADVIDAPASGALVVQQTGGVVHVRARAIVLATGARELFLPFPGWTLPNVMGIGGVQALAKYGLDVRGKRIVIAGSGPLLLPVAQYLAAHGAQLSIVAEQAPAESVRAFVAGLWRSPARLAAAARMRAGFLGAPYRFGTWVTEAHGDTRVREVTLTDGRRSWRERCDILAVGFGLIPNTELARLMGARVESGAIVVDHRQGTSVDGVFAAGECTGVGGAPLALAEGEIAGLAAIGVREIPAELSARRERERAFAGRVARAFALRDALRTLATPETILCRCEDVLLGAVTGARTAREAKLRTRAGMGACQGRVCGGAMQHLFGWEPPEPRAPIFPVHVGSLRDAGSAEE